MRDAATARLLTGLGFACVLSLSACGGGSPDDGAPMPPPLPPGTLDSSFGAGGIVLTSGIHVSAGAMLLQPDGKILVAGAKETFVASTHVAQYTVVRYLADGSRDPTFGTDGIAVASVDSGPLVDWLPAEGLALQPDGGIVVVGLGRGYATSDHLQCAIVRFKRNGTLDGAFGASGIVLADLRDSYGGTGVCRSVAIQADGRIVVAGNNFAAIRLEADGSGYAPFAMPADFLALGCLGLCGINAIFFPPDGGLLFAGSSYIRTLGGFHKASVIVTRHDADGGPVPTFGSNGVASLTDLPKEAAAMGAALDGNSRSVLAFGSVTRFNSDGTLDSGFATAQAPLPDTFLQSVAIQPNGKIVVAGINRLLPGRFEVGRMTTDGAPDPTFGAGAPVVTPVGSDAAPYAVAIQPDGRIVVMGRATVSEEPNIVLARYFGDPASAAR